jgi:hypothetical protein
MSINRKIKRYRETHKKQEEPSTKLPISDILLFLGIMSAIIGPVLGILEYDIYKNGRPEHLVSTKEGTMYKSPIPPGEPGRKESAITGFYIGGFGLVLMMFSLMIHEIRVSKKPAQKQDSPPTSS